MLNSQLPKGVQSILNLLNICLSQEEAVKRRRIKQGRKPEDAGFNADERDEWKWLADAIETPIIAGMFRELDREASDYACVLIAQYQAAVNPKEDAKANAMPLFDGMESGAA